MWASLYALGFIWAAQTPEPLPEDNQSLVFYNSRLALRDGKPEEALKWWMLRNSLWHHGQSSSFDGDFRSVAWAAMGARGICPDGFLRDTKGGAGLWPLSLYNWFLMEAARGDPPDLPDPWDAFTLEFQQRRVEWSDVLSNEELASVKFARASCWAQFYRWMEEGFPPWTDLSEREQSARLLRRLLQRALKTLSEEKIETFAAVEARLFDVRLFVAGKSKQIARREFNEKKAEARNSKISIETLESKRKGFWDDDPDSLSFLRRSLTWSANEWLTLRRERRLALFSMAREAAEKPEDAENMAMKIIDELVAQKNGAEIEAWIGFLSDQPNLRFRTQLSEGARGKSLLELDDASGFRERGPIALQRGVLFLQNGERKDAIRSFALALKFAADSKEAPMTAALARRWLSYVLAMYQTDEEVTATLRALVPKDEFNAIAEDLIWAAALRADEKSLKAIAQVTYGGTSLDARIEQLQVLATGNTGKWVQGLHAKLSIEPYFVIRLVKQWLERLEAEDIAIRQRHVPTIRILSEKVMYVLSTQYGKKNSQGRVAEEWLSRAQAVMAGVREMENSAGARARAMSPQQEVFLGALRLAPVDRLPWPFPEVSVQSPSIFVPFKLTPKEWLSPEGSWVMGWSITE